MTKLLNIDANAKTVKGQKHGYMTAVMYLAPYKTSGYNVCPAAELAGCWQTCLNTAGRGGMPAKGYFDSPGGITLPDNTIQHARIRRTRLWVEDRVGFWAQLLTELDAFLKRAERKGLTPVVRLNGTSDIRWEVEKISHTGKTIFDSYPNLQLYDYSKLPGRFCRPLPPNYHLTLSYSEASPLYARQCLKAYEAGGNMVVVVRDQELKDNWISKGATDMDEHDLRFLDPPGTLGVLKAKGSAKRETNGFILNRGPEAYGLLSRGAIPPILRDQQGANNAPAEQRQGPGQKRGRGIHTGQTLAA